MCPCCAAIRPNSSRDPAKIKMGNPEKPDKQPAERPDWGGQGVLKIPGS